MKKLFVCTGALLLLAVSPAGAQFFISSAPAHEVAAAQKADSACFRRADGKPVAIETVERDSTGIDTLRRIDTVDSDLIRLRDGGQRDNLDVLVVLGSLDGGRDGNMILEVAGFGLTLGHTPMQRMELKKPRVWFNAFSNIELGFTQLVGVDYSGYASGEKGFLDQRLGSSFHFSFSAVQLRLALNRSRSLCLGVGMQYTLDNYRLSDNTITLGNDGGRVVPVALDEPAGKSKAVTSSLGIPVRLTYTPAKHLRITAVAYSDFLLGADAIYKKPKEKNSLSGFRAYQFGVGLSVSYRGFGFFTRYGVTPLFKQHAGPDCHAFSFGVGLML